MQNQEILIGKMSINSGVGQMVIPAGGSHVRQFEMRLPHLFNVNPVVTASISSPDSNGSMFSLWSVQINNLGNETQIIFSAANVQIGTPSNFTYFVSYVIIGQNK